MSLDAPPLLTRKRNLAFALETTTNTPATLNAAAGVTNVFDPAVEYTTEVVERQAQGNLSPIAQGRGARAAKCTFETELVGSGTAATAPGWATLLTACGLVSGSGAVYSPSTGTIQTVTLGLYQHGRLKTITGAMGTFVLTLKRGQKGRIKWTFSGIEQPPTETTQILPTYVSTVAPRCGGTFTIGGVTYRAPDLEFDAGNVVVMREDLAGVDTASAPTGYRSALITNRASKSKVAPEALSLSTQNWESFYQLGTTAAASIVVGSASGNQITIAIPVMELAANPKDSDRNGVLADNLEFLNLRNSSAGDDEYSITFN